MFKVDVFVLKRDRQHPQELRRRRTVELPAGEMVHVARAEEIVLEKLEWFSAAGHWC